jgi:hypothetical protein
MTQQLGLSDKQLKQIIAIAVALPLEKRTLLLRGERRLASLRSRIRLTRSLKTAICIVGFTSTNAAASTTMTCSRRSRCPRQ